MDKGIMKEADVIRILIAFPHEERRLVSVTIRPKSISVNDLLVELGIKLTPSMETRCVALRGEGIDYVISIKDKSSNLQLTTNRVVPFQTNVPANNAVIQTEIFQKPPIHLPAKSPAQTSTSRIATPLVISKAGQVKQPAPSVRPTSTLSSSSRDGARKRKDPEVLTLSSDDEDKPGNGASCSKRGRPGVPLVKVLARNEVITPCPPCAVLKQEVTRLKCDKLDLLEHNTASHT